MIGKAGLGSYAKGILDYCYYGKEISAKMKTELSADMVRGELIHIQNLAIKTHSDGRLDMNYMAKQFIDNHMKNTKLSKFVWHQSFSFAPGEKPGNDTVAQIATEFAKEFGFDDNQMLVFRHEDSENSHFHIVANRINHNGKNTADHFKNYARTGQFCRRMEKELGLTETPDMRINKSRGIEIPLVDQSHLKLRRSIDESLNSITSIDELERHLAAKGYKTYTGRGIAFFDVRKKIKIKGSDLGRNYSLSSIEKRLVQNLEMGVEKQVKPELKKQKKRGIVV